MKRLGGLSQAKVGLGVLRFMRAGDEDYMGNIDPSERLSWKVLRSWWKISRRGEKREVQHCPATVALRVGKRIYISTFKFTRYKGVCDTF